MLAVGQVLAINTVINRFDAHVGNQFWARVDPGSWWRNVRLGWDWDENEFPTNMFLHPYHGGMYFNAGRANGLGFWESAPLAFLGSWTWEYMGERWRPSLNDFFMTSFGGITLGEVFHRASAGIRSNQARGRGRVARELLAMPFDPVGGLNRLVRGEWSRTGPNPPEHDPGIWAWQIQAGGRFLRDDPTSPADESGSSLAVTADLQYGEPFDTRFRQAFDVFNVRLQVAEGGISVLRAAGRLYSKELRDTTVRHQHIFAINARYDYVSNPSQKFGGQSVEAGIRSRWRLGKGYSLITELFADAMFLGAIDAPSTGIGERVYDFGPGLGARFDMFFQRHGHTYIAVRSRNEYLHSVSGAEADHIANFGGIEFDVPLRAGIGVGAQFGSFYRVSRYTDKPDDIRDLPEARIFLNLTSSRLTQ